MPYSLIFFVATGIIFLLQFIPLTGIYLMFLGAAFWSVFTINAGFVALGVEAFAGRVSRFWVAAPIAWFGGYFALAALNHMAVNDLAKEFERFNAGKSIPFSGKMTALVIDSKSSNLSSAAGIFVQAYDVPVVYAATPNFKTAAHLAHRIGSAETCTLIRTKPEFGASGVHTSGFKEGTKFVDGLCKYYAPEDPSLPALIITAVTEKNDGWWLPNTVDNIRITAASGQTIELKSGYAAPIEWFPEPMLGCFLNSGNASWDCFANFSREKMRGLGAEGAYGGSTIQIIAQALQLKPSPATERRKTIEESMEPQLGSIVEDRISLSVSNLDRLIADPTRNVTFHDLNGLTERLDTLGERAEAMSTAVIKTLDAGLRSRESSLNLQRMIAVLKPQDFSRVGKGLLAEFETRSTLHRKMFSDELLMRFGDLGPIAIPLLDQLAFVEGNTGSAAAILGLCRIGKPAEKLSEKVAAVLMTTPRVGFYNEQHSAAFVALLRMGRPDLADQDPDAGSYYRAGDYAKLRQTATPESSPDICQEWYYGKVLGAKG